MIIIRASSSFVGLNWGFCLTYPCRSARFRATSSRSYGSPPCGCLRSLSIQASIWSTTKVAERTRRSCLSIPR
ncbi:hypothetical protein FB451DRAFT_681279 [Mycena latifolia]|nr:hypothetical protein FB451DRAFT_681279 [Mycena latifolia]